MKANADGTLDITVEEAIKSNIEGLVIIINDGHVVAITEDK